ncbi:MAG TPA: glycosyltransferase family 39 protein [Candidatus Limnocylindria bacterium]|jgi:4-amino-4-deoxy-L-arabinose transferase-like glycosyltransferase|nr:glycosyltransferase family 39 protein [Candidatus Limnocylindria bacterium]
MMAMLVPALLFGSALAMFAFRLGMPHARDYDEGVYWESLRAMHRGHPLFGQVYSSQPPLFLPLAYAFFVPLGSTLVAARSGMVACALVGLVGMYAIGRALGGRWGGLAAAVLLLTEPLYLMQARTLQAEAPSIGFATLSVGLAFFAVRTTTPRLRAAAALLAGAAFTIALLCKLLAIATIVPLALIALLASRGTGRVRKAIVRDAAAFVLGVAMVGVPCALALAPVMQHVAAQTFGLHFAAGTAYQAEEVHHLGDIEDAVRKPLALAALLGVLAAALRRDANVVVPLGWLIATIVMLSRIVPLQPHHLVALAPPLAALAGLALRPPQRSVAARAVVIAGGLTVALATFTGAAAERHVYREEASRETIGAPVALERRALAGLRAATKPGEVVVTDAQFLAGLAGLDIPPPLVDTSFVRVRSGSLDAAALIAQTSAPDVCAVLFFSGRLTEPELEPYRRWVAGHFARVAVYGPGMELWQRAARSSASAVTASSIRPSPHAASASAKGMRTISMRSTSSGSSGAGESSRPRKSATGCSTIEGISYAKPSASQRAARTPTSSRASRTAHASASSPGPRPPLTTSKTTASTAKRG